MQTRLKRDIIKLTRRNFDPHFTRVDNHKGSCNHDEHECGNKRVEKSRLFTFKKLRCLHRGEIPAPVSVSALIPSRFLGIAALFLLLGIFLS